MKEHPRLTLGEDFAQEKSWRWEDITVLTARLTLPQTKGESRREKRFDRYYRALADAYFARCEQKLLPDAAKTCRAAMDQRFLGNGKSAGQRIAFYADKNVF